jgi:hypothetical protein
MLRERGNVPSVPQSLNRYAYVLNNPLVFDDPTGLVCNGATQNMWDTLSNGTGIFDSDDCAANGGSGGGGSGSTGPGGGLGFFGGGGPDPGNGPPGDPLPSCDPTNCAPTGSSGQGAIAVGSRRLDVNKTWSKTFACNQNATQLMSAVQNNMGRFADNRSLLFAANFPTHPSA